MRKDSFHNIRVDEVNGYSNITWEVVKRTRGIMCSSSSVYHKYKNTTELGNYYDINYCDSEDCHIEECHIYQPTIITKRSILKINDLHSYYKKEYSFGICHRNFMNGITCNPALNISTGTYNKVVNNTPLYVINRVYLVDNPTIFYLANAYFSVLYLILSYVIVCILFGGDDSIDTDIIVDPIYVNDKDIDQKRIYWIDKCIICFGKTISIGYSCHVVYCYECYKDHVLSISDRCPVCRQTSILYNYSAIKKD